eukprot:scaffold28188_cov66-Phaeocystis_antarctica.AAC.10
MHDPVSTVDGHVYERVAIRQWLLEHDTLSIRKAAQRRRPIRSQSRPASARPSSGRSPAPASLGQPRSVPATWQASSGWPAIPALFSTQARQLAQDGRGAGGKDPHPVPRAPRHDHPISGGPRRRGRRRRRRGGCKLCRCCCAGAAGCGARSWRAQRRARRARRARRGVNEGATVTAQPRVCGQLLGTGLGFSEK